VVGYLLRTQIRVRLQVIRCDPHASRANIPQVLAWGSTLVLRFGHKQVRKVFLYGEQVESPVPRYEDFSQTPLAPVDHEQPAPVTHPPIPLADSPDPASARIQYDAEPTFKPDENKSSPDVP
jgi:hypothetical protein